MLRVIENTASNTSGVAITDSNLFITINSNRLINDSFRFQSAVRHFFQNITDFMVVKSRGDKPSRTLEQVLIGDMDVEYGFEVGKKNKLYHVHGLFQSKVRKDYYLNLDLPTTRQWFTTFLGYAPHIDVKNVKGVVNSKEYIKKSLREVRD